MGINTTEEIKTTRSKKLIKCAVGNQQVANCLFVGAVELNLLLTTVKTPHTAAREEDEDERVNNELGR